VFERFLKSLPQKKKLPLVNSNILKLFNHFETTFYKAVSASPFSKFEIIWLSLTLALQGVLVLLYRRFQEWLLLMEVVFTTRLYVRRVTIEHSATT
jgi:hypothetical protein